MEIVCKTCQYHYDFARYGETCPQCGQVNTPFRSQAARRLMDYETDALRGKYFSNAHAERREALARTGDPMYGKSVLRRLRPYLVILVVCFAVAMLGQILMRYAAVSEAARKQPSLPQAADQGVVRPPIIELASAAFSGKRFGIVDGIELRVTCAGTVEADDVLSQQMSYGDKCIFVDIWAHMDSPPGTAGETFPGSFSVLCGNTEALSAKPSAPVLRQYTPFDPALLWTEGDVSGQLFFLIPEDETQFYLCWKTPDGIEQRMSLYL